MRGGGRRSRGIASREGAALRLWRDRLGLVLALLAFLSQSLALPLHQMGPADPTQRAASELKAVFGDAAFLCVQSDDGKTPAAPLDPGDSHCPLCQAGAGALAAVLPTPPAQPERMALAAARLAPERAQRERAAPWRGAAQPRGPPSEA